jgi:hypothetical protein
MTLSNYFGSAKNEVLKGNFFSALLSQFEKKVFKASTLTTKIIQWSKLPPKFSSIKNFTAVVPTHGKLESLSLLH